MKSQYFWLLVFLRLTPAVLFKLPYYSTFSIPPCLKHWKIKQWVIPVFIFFMFHNNDVDAIILANLLYSPRACLWEHHVYCAVLSTSMECNICHGCHSQWRCHFGLFPTGLPSAEGRVISNTKGAKLKTDCHGIPFSQYTPLMSARASRIVHVCFKYPRFIGT